MKTAASPEKPPRRSASDQLLSEKSAEHRPNPRRAIYLSGEIDGALVGKLTPQVISLCSESRDPITVYIDSPGGSVFHSTLLLRLLRATDQDSTAPCRIITTVTSYAGSAAADFLVSGDYAVAYPDSLIHFHGARTQTREMITMEGASGVAKDLRESNNRSAITLTRNAHNRFFFRFFSLRSSFSAHRIENPKLGSDDDVFLDIISEKLSRMGHRVVERAKLRKQRYQAVSDYVMKSKPFLRAIKSGDSKGHESQKRFEAEMLRAMVNFELKKNRRNPDWSFANKGLAQLGDDFILLHEYIGHHGDFERLCSIWRDFLITPQDEAELKGLSAEEANRRTTAKLAAQLIPLRLFFGALCHALQEEENPMTALDAFWLGLIDEVIGEDLPTERKVFERRPVSGGKRKQ